MFFLQDVYCEIQTQIRQFLPFYNTARIGQCTRMLCEAVTSMQSSRNRTPDRLNPTIYIVSSNSKRRKQETAPPFLAVATFLAAALADPPAGESKSTFSALPTSKKLSADKRSPFFSKSFHYIESVGKRKT